MQPEIYYDEDRNEIPMPLEEWKTHLAAQASEGKVFDANGIELQPGDSIIAIKSLPVAKWVNINQGEKFTKIRFTDDTALVLAKHDKNGDMYLKTEFFKKA
jgi:protein PhnA